MDDADRTTMTFAPLWVFSALTGSHSSIPSQALDALWASTRAAVPDATGLGRDVLLDLLTESDVLVSYELDGRPVASGLLQVADVLRRLPPDDASSVQEVLLTSFGQRVARARGPFGRSISREDQETLELVAELLDLDETDPGLLFAGRRALRGAAGPPRRTSARG